MSSLQASCCASSSVIVIVSVEMRVMFKTTMLRLKAKVKFLSWRHSHLSNWDWRETVKEKRKKNSFITLHNSIIQFAHNIPSTILLLNSLFADWSWKYLNSQLFHIVSEREKKAMRFCVWENSFYDRTQYRMNLIGYIRIMKRAGVKNS